MCMFIKCNAKMKQLTNNYTVRFSDEQISSLNKLKDYNVDIARFIRQAIKEKIQREWKQIKEEKERIKMPF